MDGGVVDNTSILKPPSQSMNIRGSDLYPGEVGGSGFEAVSGVEFEAIVVDCRHGDIFNIIRREAVFA